MKLLRFALMFVCLLNAQTKSETQPGDVFLIDPATSKPFLWIHAASGIMEPVSGYKPEQVYRLLIEREKACWDIHLQLVGHVNATLTQKSAPLVATR